jgi:hypothetical protein
MPALCKGWNKKAKIYYKGLRIIIGHALMLNLLIKAALQINGQGLG